ncbi:MAG: DUF6445 family protein [Cellvibrionaceae bacterium]|nr:DUF6445 family protein [Cellvibrionaceae bacterium]
MSDVDVEIKPHPELSVKVCHFGNENAPLVVIDNFVANPESLVEAATHLKFSPAGRFFPGVRAAAPSSYQSFLLRHLRQILKGVLCSDETQLKLLMCHFFLDYNACPSARNAATNPPTLTRFKVMELQPYIISSKKIWVELPFIAIEKLAMKVLTNLGGRRISARWKVRITVQTCQSRSISVAILRFMSR